MKNLGYGEGGAITAALFLDEFVGDVPWAHIDIAGTAQSTDGRPWHTPGCTGFGARLLVELASTSAPALRSPLIDGRYVTRGRPMTANSLAAEDARRSRGRRPAAACSAPSNGSGTRSPTR